MPAGGITKGMRALFTLVHVTPRFSRMMAFSSEFQHSRTQTVPGAEAENRKCWYLVICGIRLKNFGKKVS